MSDSRIDDETRELLDYTQMQASQLGSIPWNVNSADVEDPEIRIGYVSDKSDDDNTIRLRGTLTRIKSGYNGKITLYFDLNQRKTQYYFKYRADTSTSTSVRSKRYDQVDGYVGKLRSLEIVETPDPEASEETEDEV